MKITSITWGSDIALLAEACAKLGIVLSAWIPRDLEESGTLIVMNWVVPRSGGV